MWACSLLHHLCGIYEMASSARHKYATWQMYCSAPVSYRTLAVAREGYARKRWQPFQT